MKYKKRPLVSVIIPNRNHSKYIGEAIESALAQTYENVEIIVCDNCSDDDSLDITMRYLDRGVVINKNPVNIFNSNYSILDSLTNGEYFILLCADDIIKPLFIEHAVSIMEENPQVGYVQCERDYIDENGNITKLDPFFNCSFISSGESMLPIYMLTDVGQAAQTLIRRSTFKDVGGYDTETDHLNIDRELWFRLSMVSDYAYIREKLSLIRVHNSSETSNSTDFFVHPLSIYVMIKGFIEWAKIKKYNNILENENKAMHKLALEVLAIAKSSLATNNISLIRQCVLFASILDKEIVEDEEYKNYIKIIENEFNNNTSSELSKNDKRFEFHRRNYDPPEGYNML